jgi:outer membrane protein TolC
MRPLLIGRLGLLAVLGCAAHAAAQDVRATPDSVGYASLQAAAATADPRQRQLRLQEAATELRLRSLAAERLPALALNGQTQYQSAVTKLAVSLPGVTIPTPAHDTYDAHLAAEQPLLDPTFASRREVERARLAESQAQVRATLFGLRQEVADAFFTAATLQERMAELDAAITDLAARLRESVARFRQGTALRADTASIAATIDERRQDRLALASDRAAALARLALLTGRPITDGVVLVAPATAALVRDVTRSLDTLRTRPEYEQFAATRERLARQSRLALAQERPRVSAYGRLGYGRPGLNMLSTDFQTYWLAGLQLRWTPFRWGTTGRERELLELEREVVATNEAAFTRSLQRSVQPALATIARLDSTLALDARVIALREQVVRDARAQLAEGAITAATYVDRSSELLAARIRRVQHRVALEQAHVTLLNTLGVEVR